LIPSSLAWWLYYHAGLSSPNSSWYLFWSGFGADWTRIGTIFTAISLYAHHHRKSRNDR
jgi:hypothetical protein